MRSKKGLIISIFIMLVMGLFAIFFAFSKALQPTKAQWYSYQVKNYIGDMQVNQSKRIDWIHGSEVLVIRTNSSVDMTNDYRVFLLDKYRYRDKDFYFMQVTDNWVDSFGYCGFSPQKYTHKNKTANGIVYCNYRHMAEWDNEHRPTLIYDLEGMSIKFANMKLNKPFYKVSSDGYITVNVVEF